MSDPNIPQQKVSSFIGTDWIGKNGWFVGQGEPCRPSDLDEKASALRAPGYEVDEVGFALINRVSTDDGRSIFHAGAAFFTAPTLWIDRKAVIGMDKITGRRVAFGISGTEAGEVIAEGGEIWLRFSGDMLLPFDVKVSAQSTASP